ncbi:MAG: DUF4868 domain-containing protein [Alcaligenaceae bacterium]|nr:MAG: DUF4868 domain-containing protein [Alcaligenaceae bacterium]
MFNLFALVQDPAKRIQRFPLDGKVQKELTEYLENQEAAFNTAEAEHEFDGKYKPDPGELLVINEFDDINGLGAAIADPMSVHEVDPTPVFFETITAIFSGRIEADDTATVLLQNFDRRRVLSNKGLTIFHSTNTFKKLEGVGLTIDWKLAAILSGTTLKFTSFHNARQIFDLSDHYIEATDADLTAFADMEVIQADKKSLVATADTWIRRKIALVQQSQILTKVPLPVIQAAAASFGIVINFSVEGGVSQLVLPEQKAELKTLLRFLDEDYYESPLSKTHFISNSKRNAAMAKKVKV